MMKSLLLLSLSAVTLFALTYTPTSFFQVEANSASPRSAGGFENYDIRLDSSTEAVAKLKVMRGPLRRDLPTAGSAVDRFKVENADLGFAEVISPRDGTSARLASTSDKDRTETLKTFIATNHDVFGLGAGEQLQKVADYTNPDGNLSFAHLGSS